MVVIRARGIRVDYLDRRFSPFECRSIFHGDNSKILGDLDTDTRFNRQARNTASL
jgi:hypothetical protein